MGGGLFRSIQTLVVEHSSGTLVEHFFPMGQDLDKTCSERFSGTLLEYFRSRGVAQGGCLRANAFRGRWKEMGCTWGRLGRGWNTPGTLLEHFWNTSGTLLEHSWPEPQEHIWNTFWGREKRSRSVQKVFRAVRAESILKVVPEVFRKVLREARTLQTVFRFCTRTPALPQSIGPPAPGEDSCRSGN